MAESASPVVNSSLMRRAFRRQALIGAMALGLLAFATLVLLLELHLNEALNTRYQEALAIAERALDAHRLAAQLVSPTPAQERAPDAAVAGRESLRAGLARLQTDLQRLREMGLTPAERTQLNDLESSLAAAAERALHADPGSPAADLEPARGAAIRSALDALSASLATRAQALTERSRFLDLIARYTLFVAVLMSVSCGGLFALLTWRAQTASREVMGVLDRMAHEDVLTGIDNRRGLDQRLVIELARAHRSGVALTLAMLDLDHFKRYNDRRGHGAGDVLLRGAAQAWRHQLRPTDQLARYGGEEFTLVLPSCDADAACALIERLRPLVPERQTFSAGVATWDERESPDQLLARADRALLVAKKEGRNRTVVSGREPQMPLPLVIA